MKWLPIETAPRDGTEVIVGFEQATVWIVRSARYVKREDWIDEDEEDGWWSYSSSITQDKLDGIETPTHWLPMPEILEEKN